MAFRHQTITAVAGSSGNSGRTIATVVSRAIAAFAIVAMLCSGLLHIGVQDAAAGQAGTIVTDGAPLYVHLTNHTVIDWIPAGSRVDIMWQQDGMTEIRYNGEDGWVWDADISLDGSGGVGGYSGAVTTASGSGDHWIDVNRSNGQVTLYVGDEVYAVYWGSLSYDTSDGGFYTTASGTYYVYSMYEPLSYTPYANNYITDWVGFDPSRDNGFHSWTRDASGAVIPGGSGATAGCVGLEPSAAQAVYDFSYIGMMVVVHN
ncbi:MAG: L,D-transpeptidase [Thermomicrobiales bacterium]